MITEENIMYDNQKPLRAAAKAAVEAQGYSAEIVRGSGGARLRLKKDGKELFALVRTSSDRYLGWMRTDEGEWRGMKDADLIIAAAVDANDPGVADIYALSPGDVERAFNENLKSREVRTPNLKRSAPIFVCLDTVPAHKAWAAGGNLKQAAMWSARMELGGNKPHTPAQSATTASDLESFKARVREEFAARVGVRPEQVTVEFRVSY
jgi:hypothetical protein